MVIAKALRITRRAAGAAAKEFVLECDCFRAEPEALTCIIGLNGSGKSTLLRVLSGRLKPDAGDIWLDGTLLRMLTRYELKQRTVCIEPGDTEQMVQNLRVQDHVAAALRIGGQKLPFFHRGLRVRDAVSGFLLPEWLEEALSRLAQKRIAELSSGEKQAVRLAMCLLQNRRVIFADESTANLDVKNASAFFWSLNRIARDREATVVVVTHDLALAAEFASALYIVGHHRVTPLDLTSLPSTSNRAQAFKEALLQDSGRISSI